MISENATLINLQGLHMRPAGLFAVAMGKYDCDVTVSADGRIANGKSPMALMAAQMRRGTEVTVTCDGHDERKALSEAMMLIETGLGEM